MRYNLLTKSSTRQKSGVLRVLSGSAGAFTRISSVSGGKFLMKQYLQSGQNTLNINTTLSSEKTHPYNFFYISVENV